MCHACLHTLGVTYICLSFAHDATRRAPCMCPYVNVYVCVTHMFHALCAMYAPRLCAQGMHQACWGNVFTTGHIFKLSRLRTQLVILKRIQSWLIFSEGRCPPWSPPPLPPGTPATSAHPRLHRWRQRYRRYKVNYILTKIYTPHYPSYANYVYFLF